MWSRVRQLDRPTSAAGLASGLHDPNGSELVHKDRSILLLQNQAVGRDPRARALCPVEHCTVREHRLACDCALELGVLDLGWPKDLLARAAGDHHGQRRLVDRASFREERLGAREHLVLIDRPDRSGEFEIAEGAGDPVNVGRPER